VIARAVVDGSPRLDWRIRRLHLTLLCVVSALAPARAAAELGVTASVFSDARYRGYSLSEGEPVANLDFAYDNPSGFYAGGAASGFLHHGKKPTPLALQVDAGYAKQLTSETTIDVGVTHSNYSHYSRSERGNSFTEFYAGLGWKGLSSRLSFSPHYFEAGEWTAYGEVNGQVSPASKWTINAHLGMLVPLRTAARLNSRTGTDWSIGASRSLGRVSLHATWSDGTPSGDVFDNRRHSRSALVGGASLIL
jgi:uncharacterized protein (TIGR02001 family)